MLDWLMTLPNTHETCNDYSVSLDNMYQKGIKCLRTQLKAAKAAFFALISVKL